MQVNLDDLVTCFQAFHEDVKPADAEAKQDIQEMLVSLGTAVTADETNH